MVRRRVQRVSLATNAEHVCAEIMLNQLKCDNYSPGPIATPSRFSYRAATLGLSMIPTQAIGGPNHIYTH